MDRKGGLSQYKQLYILFPFNGCNDQCKYLENYDILIVNSNLYGVIQFVNEENIVFIKSCDHRH